MASNLPPLINKQVDPVHDRIYLSAGILIIDPLHRSGIPHVLMSIQERARDHPRYILHLLGGAKSPQDRDCRETAFKHFYSKSGDLLDGSVFESFDEAYHNQNTVVLYYPPSKYLLFAIDIRWFSERDQDHIRDLPEDFNRKFPTPGSCDTDGLMWVNLEEFIQTCKSSFILCKKKSLTVIDFPLSSSPSGAYGLSRFTTEIIGRNPVVECFCDWFLSPR
ncbi:hypothetical protein RCL1_003203 [Eukaryota sp. TZLM3-RCL]